MDPASKMIAAQLGVHTKSFKALSEHVDERYRVTFGHVEAQTTKDDPMGIFTILERDSPEKAAPAPTSQGQQPSDNDQHLDAFGKGKGKGGGWMANGGKCNICNGDGHMARDCPSQVDASGKVVGEDPCYGCNGKGHRKNECPTTNPHLKGKGKGAGGGGKNGGKGYGKQDGGKNGGKGGKGYGGKGWGKSKGSGKGKGGGLYDLDLWSNDGASDWGWNSGSQWSGGSDWPSEQGLRSLNSVTVKANGQPKASAAAVDEFTPIRHPSRVLQSFDELAPIGDKSDACTSNRYSVLASTEDKTSGMTEVQIQEFIKPPTKSQERRFKETAKKFA